jgi:DNA-binding response OmpR family regulator
VKNSVDIFGGNYMLHDLSQNIQLWIAEDEDDLRETLASFLANDQRKIEVFENGQKIIESLRKGTPFDIIIADLLMPEVNGLQVLEEAKKFNPDGVVIIMTGYASIDTAIQAIRGGAYDYIRKPFKFAELEVIVHNACEKIFLLRENKLLLHRLKEMTGEMKNLRENPDENQMMAQGLPFKKLDGKISEMDVMLNQMIPADYEHEKNTPGEKTLQALERLIQLRKEGFINEAEFISFKKRLLQS